MKRFKVTGMSCAACSARVESAVNKLEGTQLCTVNLLTGYMSVEGNASESEIIDAVTRAGYGAKLLLNSDKPLPEDAQKNADNDKKSIIWRLVVSCVLLLSLMYISMGHNMLSLPLPALLSDSPALIGICQFFLSLAILLINCRFFISGAKGVLHGAPNMDTLVAIGSGASFFYSSCLLIRIFTTAPYEAQMHLLHGLYFESAAMILTLITVGKLLEASSKKKTTAALSGLVKLYPKNAVLLVDGKEISVDIDKVKKGDVFVVRAGQSIPVDGVVIEGNASVDQSSLTGESVPVEKGISSEVYTATTNTNGYIVCRATNVGEDTTLSQIIRTVNDAVTTKAPIAKAADKAAGVFVPVVITIAAISTAVWLICGADIGYALARGISVLVISCPCALGLATPVAIMAASGRGAANGILFKNASVLELAGKARIVAFDKTGTLTKGVPTVTDVILLGASDEETLLSHAYALESKSEHPLARAVVSYAEARGASCPECSEVKILTGTGISATVGGEECFCGNEKLVESVAVVNDEAKEKAVLLAKEGKTPLFFAKGGTLIGIIAVSDELKEDSAQAVKSLREAGIEVVMITGDNENTAQAVASKLGISSVMAGVLPTEKEAAIRKLKENGTVVMVGDGINDAPALCSADVPIAIGAGSQIALDSAEIVLPGNSVYDVVRTIKLSRKTLRIIRQNLFWAFFYNALGIPLAAGVFVSLTGWELEPMFGAAAMSMSSLFVVLNALRLNYVDIGNDKKGSRSTHIERKKKKMKKTMKIEGMMCPHCEARVRSILEGIDGVESAEVSHKNGTAILTLTNDVENDVLVSKVSSEGYRVTDCK